MKHCTEIKNLLAGGRVTFNCKLVALNKESGVLKYILENEYKVGSLILPKGSITYAFYWIDRPYTLYKWFDKNGKILSNYFNVADSISLTENEFKWRDLIVDILVSPKGVLEVLDENEVPYDLDRKLMNYIKNSKTLILQEYKFIIEETDELISQ